MSGLSENKKIMIMTMNFPPRSDYDKIRVLERGGEREKSITCSQNEESLDDTIVNKKLEKKNP